MHEMTNLFQQFYNRADSTIVGNYPGQEALAAMENSVTEAMPKTEAYVMIGG